LANYLKKFKIDVTFVNITDLESVKNAIRPNTKVVYTESMTNPMLQISNIPELAKILDMPQDEVVFQLMSLLKYGFVETGEVDDMDEYFYYKIKSNGKN